MRHRAALRQGCLRSCEAMEPEDCCTAKPDLSNMLPWIFQSIVPGQSWIGHALGSEAKQTISQLESFGQLLEYRPRVYRITVNIGRSCMLRPTLDVLKTS